MRNKELDNVILELERIIKEYEDKYEDLVNETDMKCKRKEYWKGGMLLHIGAYCPSKTIDMICGNVDRGRRVRKEPKVGYTYLFDNNDLLIRADWKSEDYNKIKKMNEAKGKKISPVREFIFYRENEMYTVQFGCLGDYIDVASKCIYKNGYIQEYFLYISAGYENEGTIEGERYIYSENKISSVIKYTYFGRTGQYFEDKYEIK